MKRGASRRRADNCSLRHATTSCRDNANCNSTREHSFSCHSHRVSRSSSQRRTRCVTMRQETHHPLYLGCPCFPRPELWPANQQTLGQCKPCNKPSSAHRWGQQIKDMRPLVIVLRPEPFRVPLRGKRKVTSRNHGQRTSKLCDPVPRMMGFAER
jgi:hypothetical protein